MSANGTMSAQEMLNTRAIEVAMQALTKMDTHEQVCATRWRTAVTLLITTTAGVLGILITLVGYFGNLAMAGLKAGGAG